MRLTVLRFRALLPSLALLTGCAVAGAASAQVVQPGANVGVRERPRPGYDALGVRAGAFVAYPRITTRVDHRDNLFVSETNPIADTAYTLQPELSVRSDWPRHALAANAQVTAVRHADVRSEDSTSWSAAAKGQLDLGHEAQLIVNASMAELLEPRGTVAYDDVPAEPVTFRSHAVAVTASQTFSRVSLTVHAEYSKAAFDDTRDVIGDLIENSSRDNTQISAKAQVAYGLNPSTAVFVEVGFQSFDYAGDPTLNRDGQGQTILVGVDTEITRLITGEVAFGYIRHDFDNPALSDIATTNYRLGLQWYPTQLITVGVTGSQRVTDSPLPQTPEVLQRSLGVRADYELLRNLIVSAQLSASRDDFRGADRRDDLFAAALSVNYLINRTFGVTFGYRRQARWSDGADRGEEFTDNTFGVALVLQR